MAPCEEKKQDEKSGTGNQYLHFFSFLTVQTDEKFVKPINNISRKQIKHQGKMKNENSSRHHLNHIRWEHQSFIPVFLWPYF